MKYLKTVSIGPAADGISVDPSSSLIQARYRATNGYMLSQRIDWRSDPAKVTNFGGSGLRSADFQARGGLGFRLVCCDPVALQIFNLSAGPSPTLRTQFPLAASSAFGLEIVQLGGSSYAVIAGVTNLHILDVTDPDKPLQVGQIALSRGSGTAVSRIQPIGAGFLWLKDAQNEWLLDVRMPRSPGVKSVGATGYKFAHAGTLHSYKGEANRLLILRPITSLDKSIVATWIPSELIYDVHEVGTTLYVATASGITVLDIKNPAAPVVLERVGISGGARQLEVAGSNLFALGGSDRIVVFTYRTN